MSMSWKKYGGTNKLDRMNNMNVNNLTTDTFSLQNPYLGDFDICGNLHSSGNVYVDQDIYARNLNLSSNASIQGNTDVQGNLRVEGGLFAGQLDVGNLVVDSGIDVAGNLNVSGYISIDTSGSTLLYSDTQQHMGINNFNPTATVDICGNSISTLNVFSSLDYTRNIIVQNKNRKGISVETDSSSSSICFYNDLPLNPNTNAYSARIRYTQPGILTVDVSENTNILSKVVVSNRNDISNIYQETVAVYDISSGIYQYDTYKNASSKTGNAFTLIANDSSSNTMMHIITPDKKGLTVAAGSYPNDQTRTMSVFGWMDNRGTSINSPPLVPSQMIVSGNNRAKYMSSIGINTYAPRADQYILDVNGPVHITNGQFSVSQNTIFEIKSLSVKTFYTNNLIAVGTPSTNFHLLKMCIILKTEANLGI